MRKIISELLQPLKTVGFVVFWVFLSPIHQRILKKGPTIQPKVWAFYYYKMLSKTGSWLPKNSVLRTFDIFVNWGFSPLPPSELDSDFLSKLPSVQPNFVFSAFHYYRLIKLSNVRLRSVLEVGCGRGGGCKYVIIPFFNPEKYVGLDLSAVHIKECRQRNQTENSNIEFVEGSAQNMPFPSNSFDIILNVESSHCYPDFEQFLSEVRRVLRPGGLFLFTDLRWGYKPRKNLESQLQQCGLEIIHFNDVTENVKKAREGVSKTMTQLDRWILRNSSILNKHYCLEGSLHSLFLRTGVFFISTQYCKRKQGEQFNSPAYLRFRTIL